VEAIEIAYPLRVHRYGVIRDSEGAGKRRGGVGITREIEAIGHTATLGGRGDRTRMKPWGMEGGHEARGSRYYKKLGNNDVVPIPSKFQGVLLGPGDRIVIETAGGGGWGDPKEREPEFVRSDVVNGFISVGRAREIYGVAVDENTNAVDYAKTRELRG
jgi:N-methylhydantoinase B